MLASTLFDKPLSSKMIQTTPGRPRVSTRRTRWRPHVCYSFVYNAQRLRRGRAAWIRRRRFRHRRGAIAQTRVAAIEYRTAFDCAAGLGERCRLTHGLAAHCLALVCVSTARDGRRRAAGRLTADAIVDECRTARDPNADHDVRSDAWTWSAVTGPLAN